jgi:hypothetical protein
MDYKKKPTLPQQINAALESNARQLASKEAEVTKLTLANRKLVQDLEESRASLRTSRHELLMKGKEVDKLMKEVILLRSDLFSSKSKDEKIHQLELIIQSGTKDSIVQENRAYLKKIDELNSALEKAVQEKSKLTGTLDEFKREIEVLTNALQLKSEDLRLSQKTMVDTAGNGVSGSSRRSSSVTSSMASLLSPQSGFHIGLLYEVSYQRAEAKKLSVDLENERKAKRNVESKLQALQKEHLTLQTSFDLMKDSTSELTKQLDQLKADLASTSKERDTVLDYIAEQDVETEYVKREKEELKEQLSQWKALNDSGVSPEAYSTLVQEKEKVEDENRSLHAELSSKVSRVLQLEAELHQLKESIRRLESEKTHDAGPLREEAIKLSSLLSECEESRHKSSEAERQASQRLAAVLLENTRLSEAMATASAEILSLRKTKQALQEALFRSADRFAASAYGVPSAAIGPVVGGPASSPARTAMLNDSISVSVSASASGGEDKEPTLATAKPATASPLFSSPARPSTRTDVLSPDRFPASLRSPSMSLHSTPKRASPRAVKAFPLPALSAPQIPLPVSPVVAPGSPGVASSESTLTSPSTTSNATNSNSNETIYEKL